MKCEAREPDCGVKKKKAKNTGTGKVSTKPLQSTFHPRVSSISLFPHCSILGMHLFGCKFSLKTDTGDTVPDRKNFDSLLWAIVTVFQVSSATLGMF